MSAAPFNEIVQTLFTSAAASGCFASRERDDAPCELDIAAKMLRRGGCDLSHNFIAPATTVSPKRRGTAMVHLYPGVTLDDSQEAPIMQLHCYTATLSSLRAFAAPMRCSHCGDWMVAPLMSEFVESGEIRHYWECDTCGEPSSTSIELGDDRYAA